MAEIIIRPIVPKDCLIISHAFNAQGWNKPISQYLEYMEYQRLGVRDVLIANFHSEFAGYLTIVWNSNYHPFKDKGIPEIVDFNVLKKYQRQGIGTSLMDEAEKRIKSRSKYAGIGVGMTADYGAAQILYVKRGYIPDGFGLTKNGQPIPYGEICTLNDSIVLHFTKRL